MKFLILVALVGFLLPGEMDAAVTSCYSCTRGQSGCDDPIGTVATKVCPASTPYCVKTKVNNQVSRDCATLCVTVKGDDKNSVNCCDKDNCNAGMMTSFSTIAIMMSLLMAYLTKGRF